MTRWSVGLLVGSLAACGGTSDSSGSIAQGETADAAPDGAADAPIDADACPGPLPCPYPYHYDADACACVGDAGDACVSGLGGHCGGNTSAPCVCALGLTCRPADSGLPFGDVGGTCEP